MSLGGTGCGLGLPGSAGTDSLSQAVNAAAAAGIVVAVAAGNDGPASCIDPPAAANAAVAKAAGAKASAATRALAALPARKP